jgi:tetratricopeptide (TPR) repeat protein
MVATAKKWVEYEGELNDQLVAPSEFRLKKIIRDCRNWLGTSNPEDAAELYSLMGVAYFRLGNFEESLKCYLLADKLDRSSSEHKRNVGTVLLALSRPQESIQWFVDSLEYQDDRRLMTYANLAEAFARLGLHADAMEAFAEAVRAADHHDSTDMFILAAQAAELGADRDAIELYARALALRQGMQIGHRRPLDLIREAPEALKSGLASAGPLEEAIMRAELFGDALSNLPRATSRTATQVGETGDTDIEAYEATKPYRARATVAVLTDDENA